jgi:hypothetical protein
MSSISSIGSGGWSAYGGTTMPRPPAGKDGAKMKEELFTKMDSNGDNSIDAAELEAMAQATGSSSASDWFATSDTDGDGALSKDEYDAGKPPPPPERFEMSTEAMARCCGGMPPPPPTGGTDETDTLLGLDSDADGAVSAAEFGSDDDTLSSALFEALDSDGDKQLGSDEMQALRSLLDKFSQLAHYGAVAGTSSDRTVSVQA